MNKLEFLGRHFRKLYILGIFFARHCIKSEDQITYGSLKINLYRRLKLISDFSPSDLRAMAATRGNKIQRFKEQKELEKKLNELRDTVEREHVDDEVKVDH